MIGITNWLSEKIFSLQNHKGVCINLWRCETLTSYSNYLNVVQFYKTLCLSQFQLSEDLQVHNYNSLTRCISSYLFLIANLINSLTSAVDRSRFVCDGVVAVEEVSGRYSIWSSLSTEDIVSNIDFAFLKKQHK